MLIHCLPPSPLQYLVVCNILSVSIPLVDMNPTLSYRGWRGQEQDIGEYNELFMRNRWGKSGNSVRLYF